MALSIGGGAVVVLLLIFVFVLRSPSEKKSASTPSAAAESRSARITFSRSVDEQTTALYTTDADGSGLRRLTNAPGVAHTDPSWSPDGKQLVFVRVKKSTAQIWMMNADGSDPHFVVDVGKFKEGVVSYLGYPAWSPDGDEIVFVAAANNNVDVYLMDPDGTNIRRLTESAGEDVGPSWSPNGDQIVFAGSKKVGSYFDIYAMNADGGGRKQLTKSGGFDPEWSPDGDLIVYAAFTGITTMRPDGTGTKNITPDTPDTSAPSWSRDSRRIVFVHSISEKASELVVIDADGSDLTRFSHDKINNYPAWGP